MENGIEKSLRGYIFGDYLHRRSCGAMHARHAEHGGRVVG
jgi:hypothetical protein